MEKRIEKEIPLSTSTPSHDSAAGQNRTTQLAFSHVLLNQHCGSLFMPVFFFTNQYYLRSRSAVTSLVDACQPIWPQIISRKKDLVKKKGYVGAAVAHDVRV